MAIYEVMNTPTSDADLKFTSDAAVVQVNVVKNPLGSPVIFSNANTRATFQDGDNVKLKKLRVIQPYQFGPGSYNVDYAVELQWSQAGAPVDIPELGQKGWLHLNGICGDIEPNIKLAAPAPGGGDFQLALNAFSISFSQLNIPALIDNTDIFFGFQVELEHTVVLV